jgi:hypothetical protein
MSEHDISAKCARQVADLQSEIRDVRAAYGALADVVADLQAKDERLLTGLRELKAEAASQSLHGENGNAARAAFARFEWRIEQLLAYR